jgi:DNA polymerase-1
MHWTIDRPDPVRICTDSDLRALKDKLANNPVAAFDTETTGLHPTDDHILFWSLSTGDDRYFLERQHLEPMRQVMEDPERTWIGTHTKYDAHMMANAGITLSGQWYCTLVMDRMVDCDQPHGLKDVYEREFDEHVLSFGEVFYPRNAVGKPAKPKGKEMGEILLEAWDSRPDEVIEYASLDAWMSFRIFRVLQQRLKDTVTWRGQDMWDLYLDIEEPFTHVLHGMERRGMVLDVPYLEAQGKKMEEEVDRLKRKLAKVAGRVINPGSTKQLVEYFFEVKGLPVTKYTDKGAPAVDKHVLAELTKMGVEEAGIVAEIRKVDKTHSAFVTGLVNKISPDGRIHSTFNQHVADTTRLSSNNPNLQQIPNPENDPWNIRKAFIAPKGHVYLACDYDQIELYITAHFSRDPALLDAISKGRDLHAATAAFVWNENYDDIVAAKKNKEDTGERANFLRSIRQFAKVVGFGLLYGKGPNLLASELGFFDKVKAKHPKATEKQITSEAKKMAIELTEKYFDRMPLVRDFIKRTHEMAADFKYVETWMGRRRWLRQVADQELIDAHQAHAIEVAIRRHRDPSQALCWCDICRDTRAGERRATNSPVQGTASDVIQCALNQMHYDSQLGGIGLILQVHDEAGFYVPKDIVQDVKPRIQWHLENPGIDDLQVPLRAGLETGPNWQEAK